MHEIGGHKKGFLHHLLAAVPLPCCVAPPSSLLFLFLCSPSSTSPLLAASCSPLLLLLLVPSPPPRSPPFSASATMSATGIAVPPELDQDVRKWRETLRTAHAEGGGSISFDVVTTEGRSRFPFSFVSLADMYGGSTYPFGMNVPNQKREEINKIKRRGS